MLHVVIACIVVVDAVERGFSYVFSLIVMGEFGGREKLLKFCPSLSLCHSSIKHNIVVQRSTCTRYLGQVSPHHWLEDMLACVWIVDERVALGAVDDLEVLSAGLAE